MTSLVASELYLAGASTYRSTRMKNFVVYWRIATILPVILVAGTMLAFRFAGPSRLATKSELDQVIAPFKREGMGDVYYKGRKNGYDYFVRNQPYAGSIRRHIAVANSPIRDPFPYSSDSRNWRSGNQTKMQFTVTTPRKADAAIRNSVEQAAP